jgi:hypothetical protein
MAQGNSKLDSGYTSKLTGTHVGGLNQVSSLYGYDKHASKREMVVRFQRRWASKRYKGKNRRYPIYSVNFPAELNEKVEAKREKDYDLKWAETETDKEETITVTFTRKKTKNASQAIHTDHRL